MTTVQRNVNMYIENYTLTVVGPELRHANLSKKGVDEIVKALDDQHSSELILEQVGFITILVFQDFLNRLAPLNITSLSIGYKATFSPNLEARHIETLATFVEGNTSLKTLKIKVSDTEASALRIAAMLKTNNSLTTLCVANLTDDCFDYPVFKAALFETDRLNTLELPITGKPLYFPQGRISNQGLNVLFEKGIHWPANS